MTSTNPYNTGYVVSNIPETPPKESTLAMDQHPGMKDPWAVSHGISNGFTSPQMTATHWKWSTPGSFPSGPPSFVPGPEEVPSLTSSDKSDEGGRWDGRSEETDIEDEIDDDDDIQFLGQRTVVNPLPTSHFRTGSHKVTKGFMAPPVQGSRRSSRSSYKVQAEALAQAQAAHVARSSLYTIDDDEELPFAIHNILPSIITKPTEIALRRIYDDCLPDTAVDDEEGYYLVEEGSQFANRYTIVRLLGQGTFGKVVEAIDQTTQQRVAIKIIRAIPKYRDASRIELRILSMLSRYDPSNAARCVHMRECFDYRNHVCLVTELLDISVYDFLKENQFAPFPGTHILSFARQLLRSVAFVHGLGLVHTDLKPENILLSSSSCSTDMLRQGRGPPKKRQVLKDTRVTLIDFGSAIFDDEYHSSVVSTRHYRAPEIILGTGWSYPCDIWSIGCVLIELCTGNVLFQTRDNLEHLSMMEKTLETRFPSDMIASAASKAGGSSLVDGHARTLRPIADLKRLSSVSKLQPLRWLVRAAVPYTRERAFWDGFLDFVGSLLALDPRDRLTAREALEHPWLRG